MLGVAQKELGRLPIPGRVLTLTTTSMGASISKLFLQARHQCGAATISPMRYVIGTIPNRANWRRRGDPVVSARPLYRARGGDDQNGCPTAVVVTRGRMSEGEADGKQLLGRQTCNRAGVVFQMSTPDNGKLRITAAQLAGRVEYKRIIRARS